MRVHSHRSPSVLAGTLIVLFFVLSFNAYSCFLPVNGVTASTMENGCPTQDEQPVSQYCDAFKTISVQSAGTLPLNSDYQALCQEDTVWLAHHVILTSRSSRLSDYPIVGSPQDLLLQISVLRI